MEVTEISATGTVKATGVNISFVALTPAAAVATLVLRDGGAGGTVKFRVQAAANGETVVINIPDGQSFATDVHATITGAGGFGYVGY